MPLRPLLAARFALLATVSAALMLGSASADASARWTWPVQGEVITTYRNGDDPYAAGQHRGIDIAAEAGTPVAAAVAGTVRFAGVAGSSGLTVSVRTGDGRYDTSYLHLAQADVREGEHVAAGQRVGSVGTTGRRSTEAAHLHFGVRDAGSRHAYRDPLGFLPPPGPAPEPRGAPAPAPAPVPVVLAPAPVRAPSPVRVRAPGRVRVPAAKRVRIPAGRRVRTPAASRAPALSPAPVPVGVGAPSATSAAGRGSVPHRLPNADPLGRVPAPNALRQPVELADPAAGNRTPAAEAGKAAGGPDLGWALACVGLLLAAALIGGPGEREGRTGATQGARGTGAVKLRSLLRPLTGGR